MHTVIKILSTLQVHFEVTYRSFPWLIFKLVNKSSGKIMIDSNGREMRTDMSYIKLFPYVFFGCTVLGAMGNMLWFSHGYNDCFCPYLKLPRKWQWVSLIKLGTQDFSTDRICNGWNTRGCWRTDCCSESKLQSTAENDWKIKERLKIILSNRLIRRTVQG